MMGIRATRSRGLVAAVSLTALVLLGVACGGEEDSKVSASSTTATRQTDASAEALSGTVTVMAPGPLKGLLEAATTEFESDHPGVSVELNLGHVPSLLAQLEGGVAADVLVTPDARTMGQASSKGMVDGEPDVIARNPMALVVPAGNPGGVQGIDALGDGSLRVGLCAMELPCGKLAEELAAASSIKLSADTLEPGGSPGVVTKAATGEIDVGLVFATDIKAGGAKVDKIVIPDSSNVSSEISAAALTASENDAAARAFVELLASPKGRELAASAGFLVA